MNKALKQNCKQSTVFQPKIQDLSYKLHK